MRKEEVEGLISRGDSHVRSWRSRLVGQLDALLR